MVYISPEMAKSPRFQGLLSTPKFASAIAAIFVDETHCVDEWGEGFRTEYSELASMRSHVGSEVPIVACTATMSTETFDVVWKKLDFGNRPFYGIDTGVDRSNLLYLIRPAEHPENPALDALNMIPKGLTDASTANDRKQNLLHPGRGSLS